MTAILFIPSIHYNVVPLTGKDNLTQRIQRKHWKEETYLKDTLCVAYYRTDGTFDGWDDYFSHFPACTIKDTFNIAKTNPEFLI